MRRLRSAPCLQTEFKPPIYAAEASYHPSVVGPLGPQSATKVHQVRQRYPKLG